MFSDLKPYEGRVDSHAPWLGSIPAHWSLAGARSVFAEVGPPGHIDEPLLSVTIGRGVLPQSDLLANSAKKDSSNLDRSRYKLVEPGDIAYNKMRAWQGAIGLSQHRGIVSPAYVVMRPRRDSGTYFHHLLRTPGFAKEAERWSYGITSDQWSLRPEHFRMITFPVPPAGEQAAIVKYLAHAHHRIDRTIAAKRKLIALLEEQKQAIITQAVSRGLDPTAVLKDTGIPWLGQVSARWETWPLGRLARVGNGSTPARSNPEYWTGGHYPWLNSSYVNQDRINGADQFVTAAALRECHLPTVRPGSILVAITGQGKTRGRAALLETEATINQHLAYITPRPDLADAVFLQRSLQAAYRELRRISDDSGSTKGALTCQDLKSFRVPLPPLDEQRAIVAHVDSENMTAQAAIDRAHREIDLLQEFRTRLTSDAVTGQVDVRHIAAALPDISPDDLAGDVSAMGDDLVEEAAELLEDVEA